MNVVRKLVDFAITCVRLAFSGSRKYYAWLGSLLIILLFGLYTYYYQLKYGVIITGARDQVNWGLYIANFPFFVGVAAGAVMIVIPAYLYKREDFKHITIFGEILAVGAVIISLSCVLSMLGRIDRLHHILPITGTPNWPQSMLPWDVIVLNGYLFLNLLIPGYILYKRYYREPLGKWIYFFIFLSMPWALSIHTVTAFIIGGVAARPFWNTALMAPRFLASAFTVGPVLMILILQLIRRYTSVGKPGSRIVISDRALFTLAHIALIAQLTNLFFLGSEIYTVGYSATSHILPLKYVLVGLEHEGVRYAKLVPYMWASIALQVLAALLLLFPRTRKSFPTLNLACFSAFLGILIEKGYILILAGYVPTPIGELWEFTPTLPEIMLMIAIWALGFLVYTLLAKIAIGILGEGVAHPTAQGREVPEH